MTRLKIALVAFGIAWKAFGWADDVIITAYRAERVSAEIAQVAALPGREALRTMHHIQ